MTMEMLDDCYIAVKLEKISDVSQALIDRSGVQLYGLCLRCIPTLTRLFQSTSKRHDWTHPTPTFLCSTWQPFMQVL
jgi:hypothetical protein